MSESAAPASSAHLVARVIEDGGVSLRQFLVIALCVLFNMVDGFDITAMAIVASGVAADLDLSADRLGLTFSFALAGMMAGAMGLAPLSDIIGRRKLIIGSLVLIGISVLLTARATTLAEFIGLRFVSGLGGGALLASQATLAAEYSPEKYRALAVTVVTAGYPAGAMMTSVAGGLVMPDFGWRGMFWFGGIATLVMAVVALLLIPESLKYLFERRPGNALERANSILARLGKPSIAALPEVGTPGAERNHNVFGNMKLLLSEQHWKATLTLWATFFMSFSTLYFLMSWIPRLMEQTGFSAEAGREAFFLFNLSAIIGVFSLGFLATRWKLSRLVSSFLFLSAVAMVAFAAAPRNLHLLLVITFIMGFLQQGGFTGLYAVAAKLYPTSIRSTGIGWAIGLGRFGAVVGPAAAGYLIAAGFDMSMNYYLFAVPMAIGGLLAWRTFVR
ncbi:MAG: MFS transporter [Woeseiaceae bacterium]|nr:MFS transporter [Woeseiaceae bacterium]